MVRSRAFLVLAIALFLAGCVCAEATAAPSGEDPNEKTATEKVTELQALTKGVLEKAQRKLRGAQSAKTTAGDQKRKAERAEADAKTVAAEIKAGNRKTEADAVAKTAAEEWANCQRLYDAAIVKADQASETLNGFVTRARTLDNEAKTNSVPDSGPPGNYAQIIATAATAISETQRLNGEIETSTDLTTAESAVSDLQASAQKVQVFKNQAESIAVVSRIETALKTTETDIQNIQQKKKEIDTIVKEMNTKCEGAPDSSKSSLSSLCTTADSQLQTATTKVHEAQQCNTNIQERKTLLDATLATLVTLKDATEEDKATQEAAKVKQHEGFIDGELQKIKDALLAANNALSSAKGVQQQMQDKLSKTSAQPVNTHLDSTEQNKSTQLTDKQTQHPKDDKSELLNKDKLRNITKDITNNPLIGGEVPTRSAANDSAVTEFIPLLVILVISAVLH